eukprot:1159355-Pelagomonas_calceolata.AAC.7
MAPANEGNVSIEIKNPAFPEQGGTDVEMGGVGQAPQSTGPAPEQQGNNASQLLNEVPREKQVTVTLNNVSVCTTSVRASILGLGV